MPALEVETALPAADEDQTIPYGQGELVLVVEDEAALREALLESLTRWQYAVLAGADGEEALEILRERNGAVDLVVSDVVMPRLGGVGLLRAMRRQGWQIPVILTTGHPMDEEKLTAREQGVIATLIKPIDPAELARAIANALDMKRQRSY